MQNHRDTNRRLRRTAPHGLRPVLRMTAAAEPLHPLLEELPARFEREGTVLYEGRNSIRRFETSAGPVAVKRYGRPNRLNRIVYSFLRKGKARRAYEHAARLRELGIDTPEELACLELRDRWGIVRDSYFVARCTDRTSLSAAAAAYPSAESEEVLAAFARFAASLHEKGVLHRDFNHNNIRYDRGPDGRLRFELIDTNRMRFAARATPRQCRSNLRRLSVPAAAFLYIAARYAEVRGWDADDNLLRSAIARLLFERRQHLKQELKGLRHRNR